MLPPKETRTPKPWLYKTTENKKTILIDLTGGVKSTITFAPSKKSVRTCNSKSVKTYRSASSVKTADDASLETYKSSQTQPQSPPKKADAQSLDPTKKTQSTPKAAGSTARSFFDAPILGKFCVNRKTTQKTTTKRKAVPLEVASSRASMRDTTCTDTKPRRLYCKQPDPNGPKNPKDPSGNTEELRWVCRLCSMEVLATNRKMLNWRRLNHFRTRHPHHTKTDSDKYIKFRLEPIIATHEIPTDAGDWECPFCRKGLPSCSSVRQRQISIRIRLHWKTDHPNQDCSVKAVHQKRAEAQRANPAAEAGITAGNGKKLLA